MFKNFQDLDIVKDNCSTTDNHELNQKAGQILVSCYPNPFVNTTTIKFESNGGYTQVEVMDNQGRVVRPLIAADFVKGTYEVQCDLEGFADGVFYVRLQNGPIQQVKSMIKVRG